MLGKICRASRTVSPRWPIWPRTALPTENIITFLLLSVGRESFRWICSRDSSPLSWPVSGISLKSKNASAMNLVLRKSLSFTWNTKIAPSVFRCSVVRGLKKYHDKQVFFCVKKFIRIIIGRMILCVFFFLEDSIYVHVEGLVEQGKECFLLYVCLRQLGLVEFFFR